MGLLLRVVNMPEKPRLLMFSFSFVKAVQFSKHTVSVVLVIEGFSCTALFVCVFHYAFHQ